MATYKFPVKDATYQEGYTIVVIRNNLADINENDPQQVALAKKHGGVKYLAKRGK